MALDQKLGKREWPSSMTATVFALLAVLLASLVLAPQSPSGVAVGAVSVSGFAPYVALGDSVAAGLGASAPRYRYVGQLYANYHPVLGADELLDRSETGATSSSLRNGGQLATALADIDAASDTKAVTIDIGGNDYLTGQCTTNWANPSTCPFRANLASILSALKTALAADPGDERFAVMAYYNPGVGLPPEGVHDLAELGANLEIGLSDTGPDVGLNDVIYQEAAKLGIPVADPSAAFKANGQAFMADSVHPNDAGHAAIAASFCALDPPLACTLDLPPPADTDAPETTITKGAPNKTGKTKLRFRFRSDEEGSRFECRLDKARWRSCTSPKPVKHLDFGKHKFRVRAIDAAGNVDPTPAKDKFKVLNRRTRDPRARTDWRASSRRRSDPL